MADFKNHRFQDTEFEKIYNFLDRAGYSIIVKPVIYESGSGDKYYPIVKHNGKIKEFKAHLTSIYKARRKGVEFALNYAEHGGMNSILFKYMIILYDVDLINKKV